MFTEDKTFCECGANNMNTLPAFRPSGSSISFPCDVHLQDIVVHDVSRETEVILLGNLRNGQSIALQVGGFQPYFYLQVPMHWKTFHVNTFLCHANTVYGDVGCKSVEVSRRRKVMGYGPALNFAKLGFTSISNMKRFAKKFTEELRDVTLTDIKRCAQAALMDNRSKCDPLVLSKSMLQDEFMFTPYMHQLDQVLMFCVGYNLRVSDWVQVIHAHPSALPFATTQFNLQTKVKHLRPSDYHGIPPFVIASFDIETYSVSRDFPDSTIPGDVVIQIGVVLGKYGVKDRLRIVLCLGHPSPSTEKDTYYVGFDNEAELLSAFQQLVVQYDVDIITGYNIYSFDYAYLCDRAERIRHFSGDYDEEYEEERSKFVQYKSMEKHADKLEKDDTAQWKALLRDYATVFGEEPYFKDRLPPMPLVTRLMGCYDTQAKFDEAVTYFSQFGTLSFFQCSRLLHETCQHKIVILASAAMGQNVLHRFPQTGRVVVDMWLWIKNNKRLGSYKLDFVAKKYLGESEGKVVLAYSKMFDMFEEGGAENLKQIADYCVVDCDLPLELMLKLSIIPNATEMSRVCHTRYVDIFTGGQQRKVFNQIVNKTKDNWVVNKIPITKPDKYVGATVLQPIPGFHLLISTLDFASLYPSIIRMENLCYSTWVEPKHHAAVRQQSDVTYKMHMAGGKSHMFVTSKRGILPELEEELLAARKIAKKAMKAAKDDPFEYAIQNGRQLALKVSMNSIYGFCGVMNGYMPCWPIAAVTTTVGRELIHTTKELVETNYTKAHGYEADAKVIYGDTGTFTYSSFPNYMYILTKT